MRIDRLALLLLFENALKMEVLSRTINLVLECMVGVRRVNSASNLRMCTASLNVHIKVCRWPSVRERKDAFECSESSSVRSLCSLHRVHSFSLLQCL